MKKIEIISSNDPRLKELDNSWGKCSFTYMHGKLEEDCSFDIFYIINPLEHGFKFQENLQLLEVDEKMTGIHKCIHKGKNCTFYLYVVDRYSTRKEYSGLVVYDDDISAREYAKECYISKRVGL